MRKFLIALIVILGVLVFSGCNYKTGSGDIISEIRNTGSFKGVRVGGDFDVTITKGDRTEVKVEADDNLIKRIETNVEGGVLRIRSKDNNIRDAHFKIYITTPFIEKVSGSAGASINVDNIDSESVVELKASSAAKITAKIDAPEVDASASSGGELILNGRTKKFSGRTSSGASIKAMDLLSETSVISSSSGASADVFASVSLDASASSGANIAYRGNANVKKSVSSGASIDKE
ncbi:MAG: head GIN domain-containing protein [Ferruginibacter sp.]